MACHLMDARVTISMDKRDDDFEKPFEKGSKTIGAGYIGTYMKESEISEENSVYIAKTGIEGLSYELHGLHITPIN